MLSSAIKFVYELRQFCVTNICSSKAEKLKEIEMRAFTNKLSLVPLDDVTVYIYARIHISPYKIKETFYF